MTEPNFLGRNLGATSIWMPFPPPIWQCIGLQLNTESSWANQKMDRKGGSRSAARKNQCGTRSTRLVKSSETVDKSKTRDVWDIWDICSITLEQHVSEFGHLTAEAKYTQERCGWGWRGAYWGSEHRWVWSSCWHGLGRSVVQGTKNWLRSARSAIQEARWCFLGS